MGAQIQLSEPAKLENIQFDSVRISLYIVCPEHFPPVYAFNGRPPEYKGEFISRSKADCKVIESVEFFTPRIRIIHAYNCTSIEAAKEYIEIVNKHFGLSNEEDDQ